MARRFEEIDWNDDSRIEIVRFCAAQGLPAALTPWGKVIRIFALRGKDKRLEATARLEIIHGYPFIESVAVRKDLRGSGLGRMIVEYALNRARELGYLRVWAVARVPEFYRKLGFVDETDSKLVREIREDCKKCDEYLKKCFPSLMRKDIK